MPWLNRTRKSSPDVCFDSECIATGTCVYGEVKSYHFLWIQILIEQSRTRQWDFNLSRWSDRGRQLVKFHNWITQNEYQESKILQFILLKNHSNQLKMRMRPKSNDWPYSWSSVDSILNSQSLLVDFLPNSNSYFWKITQINWRCE